MSRDLSPNGLKLIKSFEGCKLTAYKCLPTEKYYTIGYGHYGSDVKAGMKITEEQAEELLSNCSAEFVDGIKLTGKNGNFIIIENAPLFWTTKYETVLGYQYYGLCVSNMNNYIGGCIRPVFK